MVLFEKVKLTNLASQVKTVPLKMTHRREFPAGTEVRLAAKGGVIEDTASGRVFFSIQGPGAEDAALDSRIEKPKPEAKDQKKQKAQAANPPWAAIGVATLQLELPPQGSKEFVVKLPSPVILPKDRAKLLALDHEAARAGTSSFGRTMSPGGQFRVPEKIVNELFRANLWHALRLPRRNGGPEPGCRIDLPYSNFAYGQHGHALAGQPGRLRGLHDLRPARLPRDLAPRSLLAMYRNNQEPNGHVGGYANWGVYTPSHDLRRGQELPALRRPGGLGRLLPPTLKASTGAWARSQATSRHAGAARGLVRRPLND